MTHEVAPTLEPIPQRVRAQVELSGRSRLAEAVRSEGADSLGQVIVITGGSDAGFHQERQMVALRMQRCEQPIFFEADWAPRSLRQLNSPSRIDETHARAVEMLPVHPDAECRL